MLAINLICVGTLKEEYLRAACAEYEKRLASYCRLQTLQLKDRSKILPSLGRRSYKIALCIEGKMLSSPELSDLLSSLPDAGYSQIDLVIGDSDGLPDEIKNICDFKLSFSKMTFPHQLMRVILLEQIYRAFNIAAGGKYHK